MKTNKGFTLIELLSVIVVLAIIALIATPIILGVIEKAEKGAAEASSKGYIDAVEKQILINEMDDDTTNDIVDGSYDVSTLNSMGVQVKGKSLDNNSRLTISNGEVTGYILSNDKYCAYKSQKSNITTYIKGECLNNLWYTDKIYPLTLNGVSIDYDYDTQIYTLNGTSTNQNLTFYPLKNLSTNYDFAIGSEYVLKSFYISGTITTEASAMQKNDFLNENKHYSPTIQLLNRYQKSNKIGKKEIDFVSDSYTFWIGHWDENNNKGATYDNYKVKMYFGKNSENINEYIPNVLDK